MLQMEGHIAFKALLVIFTVFLFGSHIFLPALAQTDLYGVPRIVDGDTLVVNGQRIRLHGIDAPELTQKCQLGKNLWDCGADASQALKSFIKNQPVRCLAQDIDRYGRIIAKCYSNESGGEDIGERMVREGWALSYRRYSRDYINKEQTAEREKLGIWQGQFIKPWDWRRGKRS